MACALSTFMGGTLDVGALTSSLQLTEACARLIRVTAGVGGSLRLPNPANQQDGDFRMLILNDGTRGLQLQPKGGGSALVTIANSTAQAVHVHNGAYVFDQPRSFVFGSVV